jgi:hypothetical protein
MFSFQYTLASQGKDLRIDDDDSLFSFPITEAILYLGGIDITI